jgi:hypothetical protein
MKPSLAVKWYQPANNMKLTKIVKADDDGDTVPTEEPPTEEPPTEEPPTEEPPTTMKGYIKETLKFLGKGVLGLLGIAAAFYVIGFIMFFISIVFKWGW